MPDRRPKIALWHRYGPGGHTACGGHCIPEVVRLLSAHSEVHYFGMKSREPVPPLIRDHAILHSLPFVFDRASTRDKLVKTVIWYLLLPFIALRCRFMGVSAVYMDETLPLAPLVARVFFGPKVAITVADFFLAVYFERVRWMRPVCRMLQRVDYATWRRLPLVFTKTNYTHGFLTGLGVKPDRIHTSYNPCDRAVYHPADRAEARRRLGLAETDFVLVHHGILHPNKGNDQIIRTLARLSGRMATWRYLLIGSGPEMEPLKKLCAELGVSEKVIFTGWLAAETDVNWALNAADVGLVMRIGQATDNFHVTDTLVHEMACGLPILAAGLKGIAEIVIEGDSGLLFQPTDMDEFAAKLETLAADPDTRRRLGRKALALSTEYFDLNTISSRMAEALLGMAAVQGRTGLRGANHQADRTKPS